jgi:hypothetical protein
VLLELALVDLLEFVRDNLGHLRLAQPDTQNVQRILGRLAVSKLLLAVFEANRYM